MAEKEKVQNKELKKVSGGGMDPLLKLFKNPLIKYVCKDCDHEFEFRQPGDLLHHAAVWVGCPKCGSHNLRHVCEISE